MTSSAQLKAQAKYDKQNTKQTILKLNRISDADILMKLENVESKQGYIKSLIRNDMRNLEPVLSLETIKYLLLPVVKKYDIKSLSVFGSYARGEATALSDIDILIDGGNYGGLVGYMNMINAMKESLGKDVDVVTLASLNENASQADIIFRQNIEKDKVVLL